MVIVNQCPLKKPFLQTKALSRKSSKTWMPQEPHQKLGIRILWWQIPPNLRNLLTPDKNNIFLNSYTSGLDTSKFQIYQPILVPLRFKKILSKNNIKTKKKWWKLQKQYEINRYKKNICLPVDNPYFNSAGSFGGEFNPNRNDIHRSLVFWMVEHYEPGLMVFALLCVIIEFVLVQFEDLRVLIESIVWNTK